MFSITSPKVYSEAFNAAAAYSFPPSSIADKYGEDARKEIYKNEERIWKSN